MAEPRSSALDAYSFVTALLFGREVNARMCARAYALPVRRWERMLALEGCAAPLYGTLRRRKDLPTVPESLQQVLREAFRLAVQRGLQIQSQLAEIAIVAKASGIRILALKGAARLLRGEMAGTRSVADIDLLVPEEAASSLHELLRARLGYGVASGDYSALHHFPGLTRAGAVGVEIHTRLSDRALPLDEEIWRDARPVHIGDAVIEVPSADSMVLHALEHAVALNWDLRYRLRDILDIASLWTADVDAARIHAFIASSPHRRAMETLLSAAHEVCPAVLEYPRVHAMAVIRRVARARLWGAMMAEDGATAFRVYRYAGVLAELSPPELRRASWQLLRGGFRAALGAVALAGSATCTDATAPHGVRPPAVLFASRTDAGSAIFRLRNDTLVRFSAPGEEDSEPRAVGERVTFTSRRTGNAEVYVADRELQSPQRLTSAAGFDGEAALDPAGAAVAFVSDRSGTPRVWLMDADGANPRALVTGSEQFVPERAPAWNPSGERLAFTSARTNTSQVYVIARTGGQAVQLTHESTGAFDPSWSADGTMVLYTSLAGPPTVMAVPAAGGDAKVFAADERGLGEVACGPSSCVAVVDPLGAASSLVVIGANGERRGITAGTSEHRHPSIQLP